MVAGSDLLAVEGGNSQICDGLLKNSKQTSIQFNTLVKSIKSLKRDDGSSVYLVESSTEGTDQIKEEEFDAVVLATPLETSNIQIQIDGKIEHVSQRKFQTTHVTVVVGKVLALFKWT